MGQTKKEGYLWRGYWVREDLAYWFAVQCSINRMKKEEYLEQILEEKRAEQEYEGRSATARSLA